ncbi:MAG: zf-HC2 domain-containing protein [Planctomycetes bacterium]|nr:zf-HC2 domain-containing protein [Planctomycetota bacterium]
MWNCEKIRDVLPLAIGNDLPAAGMEAVRVHLAGCEECGEEMARYRRASEALRQFSGSLGRAVRAEGLWAGIEASLNASAGPAPAPVLPFPVRPRRRLRDLAAVAAVFAIGIGIGLWANRRVSTPSLPNTGFNGGTASRGLGASLPGLSPFALPVSSSTAPSNYVLRNFMPPAASGDASGVIDTVEIPLPARPHFRIEQACPVEEEDVEMRF